MQLQKNYLGDPVIIEVHPQGEIADKGFNETQNAEHFAQLVDSQPLSMGCSDRKANDIQEDIAKSNQAKRLEEVILKPNAGIKRPKSAVNVGPRAYLGR